MDNLAYRVLAALPPDKAKRALEQDRWYADGSEWFDQETRLPGPLAAAFGLESVQDWYGGWTARYGPDLNAVKSCIPDFDVLSPLYGCALKQLSQSDIRAALQEAARRKENA